MRKRHFKPPPKVSGRDRFYPYKHDPAAWRDIAAKALIYAEHGLPRHVMQTAVNQGLCLFPIGPGGPANHCQRLLDEIEASFKPPRPLNAWQRPGVDHEAVAPGSPLEIRRLAELVIERVDAFVGSGFAVDEA